MWGDGCQSWWKAANGLTIGILPTDDTNAISKAVDIAIITDMGNARNNINLPAMLSLLVEWCRHCIRNCACPGNKKVILLNDNEESRCFSKLSPQNVYVVDSPSN